MSMTRADILRMQKDMGDSVLQDLQDLNHKIDTLDWRMAKLEFFLKQIKKNLGMR